MESEPAEKDLWQRFKVDNDLGARDQLMHRYQPWANAIARSVHRRVRAYPVDCEDFVQNAAIGLMEAMSRYDPGRGIAFHAYAKCRVRGAVFNGLRAILADRSQFRQERYMERLESMQESGGAGDALELVLDAVVGLGLGFLLEHGSGEAAHTLDGLFHAQSMELQSGLDQALRKLPERLAEIVRDHYFQHVPFVEIARRAGVSKGRISQLHREALLQLRKRLHDHAGGLR
jgi:RNA polymerase sigma factor for flagellar operon FliA